MTWVHTPLHAKVVISPTYCNGGAQCATQGLCRGESLFRLSSSGDLRRRSFHPDFLHVSWKKQLAVGAWGRVCSLLSSLRNKGTHSWRTTFTAFMYQYAHTHASVCSATRTLCAFLCLGLEAVLKWTTKDVILKKLRWHCQHTHTHTQVHKATHPAECLSCLC